MKRQGRMKVIEISSYPPPRSGWGMRVYFVKREMEKQGHICTVLNTGKGRFLADRDFVPVFGGIDYALKVLKYRLKGYLIHMHLNGDSPKGFVLTLLSLLISILTLCRPVITFHAGPVQKYFPQKQAPYLTLLYKFIFTIPRHIICNNEIVKKTIMSYGISSRKIIPIQAFSVQYLNFEKISLSKDIEDFFNKYTNIISSYVFYRPEFFVENMIRSMKSLLEKTKDFGLIIMGSDIESSNIKILIDDMRIKEHILIVGDRDHDEFLTILSRSKIYLRTPVKDGVCSSVLESLYLGVPVVASENGTRPASVITYHNGDIDDMVEKIFHTLENHTDITHAVVRPKISDTVCDEIEVLRDKDYSQLATALSGNGDHQ